MGLGYVYLLFNLILILIKNALKYKLHKFMFIYAAGWQHYIFIFIFTKIGTLQLTMLGSTNDRTIQLILQGLFPSQLPSFNCSICLNGTQLDVVKLHHLKWKSWFYFLKKLAVQVNQRELKPVDLNATPILTLFGLMLGACGWI